MTKRAAMWVALATLAGAPTVARADYYVQSVSQDDGGADVVVTYDTADPVEYRIQADASDEEKAAIEAAFETWADVECAEISFMRGDDVAEPTARHWISTEDRYVLVYWSDDAALFPQPSVGFFDWAHDGNGVMVGAQVILNSRHHSWSTTGEDGMLDVQSVVTALAGRSLTITSDAEGNATYPKYSAGDTSKRTLGDDDVAALQYIYGDGTCDPAPEEPTMICNETTPNCPPPVATDPGDGTAPPDGGTGTVVDAGTTGGGADGGVGADGDVDGTGADGAVSDDDGGCGCVAAGADRTGSGGAAPIAALGLLAFLVGWRLRRRR